MILSTDSRVKFSLRTGGRPTPGITRPDTTSAPPELPMRGTPTRVGWMPLLDGAIFSPTPAARAAPGGIQPSTRRRSDYHDTQG